MSPQKEAFSKPPLKCLLCSLWSSRNHPAGYPPNHRPDHAAAAFPPQHGIILVGVRILLVVCVDQAERAGADTPKKTIFAPNSPLISPSPSMWSPAFVGVASH
jgi:hypothetical protein